MKRLIAFDLDGTLASSKSPLDPEMVDLIKELLGVTRVAIISGGSWGQFQHQVLSSLAQDHRLQKLSLLPTCGTKFYRYDETWHSVYSEDFTSEEKSEVLKAFNEVIPKLGYGELAEWGEQIEDRGSQITFSALGQQAPLEAKVKWDPDFAKRKQMKALLDPLLPEFSVHLGGSTSVDVTRHGIDKGHGIRKLREILGIPLTEMIFVGDALFPGGNDYPAKQAGALSIQVKDPHETKRVIEAIIACFDGTLPDKALEG